MAWHFEDEPEPYADRVLDCLRTHQAFVPVLFFYEVANALLFAERKQRTTTVKTDALFDQLAVLPLEMDREPPLKNRSSIMALARAHRLTAYDAAYLELDQCHHLPKATLDGRHREAAFQIGDHLVFQP